MKIKFVIVNTDKGIEVETFFFEVNNFEMFKRQIELCISSNKYWGSEENEGFAYAMLENHKDISKTLDSFDSNDEGRFPISTTIKYSSTDGVTTTEAGLDYTYMDHPFFKEIDKSTWEKYELEFTKDLFNFYLTKSYLAEDIRRIIDEYDTKYDFDFSEFQEEFEEFLEHLKNKFPEEYKLSLEDLKNDGSDDPMGMTPGYFFSVTFVDHIVDKGEEFLKEYEAILKKCLINKKK